MSWKKQSSANLIICTFLFILGHLAFGKICHAQEQLCSPSSIELVNQKSEIAEDIVINLSLPDIMIAGGKQGALTSLSFSTRPQIQKDLFSNLYDQEISLRKTIIIKALARANVDRFSIDDLKLIKKITRISKNIQTTSKDFVSKNDKDFFLLHKDDPCVVDFLNHFDIKPAMLIVEESVKISGHKFNSLVKD